MYQYSDLSEMNLPKEQVDFFQAASELGEALARFSQLAASLSKEAPMRGAPPLW
jgi:hypothetical protein